LPGEDGLAICRRLRAGSSLPIIMLTAMGEEMDRIVGLEMGADDYLPKAANPRELLARVRAVLRPGWWIQSGACEQQTAGTGVQQLASRPDAAPALFAGQCDGAVAGKRVRASVGIGGAAAARLDSCSIFRAVERPRASTAASTF